MKLKPNETRLDGALEMRNGRLESNSVANRIKELTSTCLERIAVDSSGWDVLYRDPGDGRYWELLYLHSEMHGGGPPTLVCIEPDAARAKYALGQ